MSGFREEKGKKKEGRREAEREKGKKKLISGKLSTYIWAKFLKFKVHFVLRRPFKLMQM